MAQFSGPVRLLAADGWLAAFATSDAPGKAVIAIWSARTGAVRRANPFVPETGGEELAELAVAGDRAAWIFSDWELRSFNLSTLVVDGEVVHQVDRGRGEELLNLHGDDDVIAFNVSALPDTLTAWHVTGSTAIALGSNSERSRVRDVDQGQVLLEHPDAILEVVTADGTQLGKVHAADFRSGARLDGSALVVLSSRGLEAYDVRTGLRRRLTSIPLDGGPPRLEDVERGLAVYVADGSVHVVRLADARQLTIRPKANPESVGAQLEETGLYFAYNEEADSGGRVVFVPLSEVTRFFRDVSP